MKNIYTKYPQMNEDCNQTIGKLGILVGLSFKHSPDVFFRTNNTRSEFFDCYQRVHSSDNVYGARIFCIDELFKVIKDESDSIRAYDMKILATLPEADILMSNDLEESIGVLLTLNEGNPDTTTVTIVDYDKWETIVLVMENS